MMEAILGVGGIVLAIVALFMLAVILLGDDM